MVKIAIKSEKLSPFGGIFSIMELFDSKLSSVIDSTLGMRCRLCGYQYSEIIRSLMSVYLCGGTCIEDMTFYIRANRCGSLYDDIFALRGWKKEELGGIEYELNSILVEKWKGKAYRLVIQRQKRMNGELDLWEGEYTYRCILTNDYESSEKEIVEFYNLRGGKERIFDDKGNDNPQIRIDW